MKIILFYIFTLIVTVQVSAQTQAKPVVTYRLDQKTVVKDSSGKIYAFEAWSELMKTRQYILRPVDMLVSNPEFLLIRRDSQQQTIAPLSSAPQSRNVEGRPTMARVATVPYKPAESEQFKTGDIFKLFKDKDINGEKLDLKQMAGKVFVINFWFIGCPPCRAEIPDLNEIVARYKDNKEVVFIAIALDEKYEIKEFLKYTPFNYHIIESGSYIARKYGVNLFPTNVIIDRQGKVAFSSVSNQPSNPYWMKKTIDDALAASVNTAAR